jgi:hypothetical protein
MTKGRILIGLVAGAGILLLFVIFWTNQRVSISLPGADFSSAADYVRAHGSWIADTDFGIIHETPINTTEIKCYRSTGYCKESRSYKNDVTGNMLSQSFEYKITNWTVQEISGVYDGLAGAIEIRIDIPKKLITMTETEKQGAEGARKLPAYAHLGDGTKALEAARK